MSDLSGDELPGIDFEALFRSLPARFAVLDPQLRIIAVNDAYLQASMAVREKIIGRNLLEVFPDNPDDPEATGVATCAPRWTGPHAR